MTETLVIVAALREVSGPELAATCGRSPVRWSGQPVHANILHAEFILPDAHDVVRSDLVDPQTGGRRHGAEPASIGIEDRPAIARDVRWFTRQQFAHARRHAYPDTAAMGRNDFDEGRKTVSEDKLLRSRRTL